VLTSRPKKSPYYVAFPLKRQEFSAVISQVRPFEYQAAIAQNVRYDRIFDPIKERIKNMLSAFIMCMQLEERSSATRRKSDIARHIQFGSVEPIPLAWLSLSFCKCRKKHQELQVRASCLRDS
jgi:hypothetical protein